MHYPLARKYPNAERSWAWQWVLPQQTRRHNRATGTQGRHHLDPSVAQMAVKRAVAGSGVTPAASCHTCRHSWWLRHAGLPPGHATRLLECGQDIRTIRERLGHQDVSTAMIYTQLLNRAPLGVRSPADLL